MNKIKVIIRLKTGGLTMREILFRGKRVDDGEWVYGFYSQFHNRPAVNEPNSHQIFELIDEGVRLFGTSIGGYWHIIDPETVGQYTGLTANGTKIFEGDIVVFNKKRNLPNYRIKPEVVFYDERNAQFTRYKSPYATLQKDMMSECEVIGNIHDNPELLKEGVTECPKISES